MIIYQFQESISQPMLKAYGACNDYLPLYVKNYHKINILSKSKNNVSYQKAYLMSKVAYIYYEMPLIQRFQYNLIRKYDFYSVDLFKNENRSKLI